MQSATAKTAFLTTAGFPNILHYRQGGKERPFDLSRGDLPPYVPGEYTFEIPERINAEGGIDVNLDEEAVSEVIASLVPLQIEAVAVCFLWSTSDPSRTEGRHTLPDIACKIVTRNVSLAR